MKYAGLMKPPPMLTQDVYEHIISQVASNYVKALNRKVREFKKFRVTEEPRYEPLLTAIDELRDAADSKGTRDIYSKYKHFGEMSRGFFGYGYFTDFKMKAFSGVKSSERREAVKALIEEQIEKNLEAMEGRLAYGERMIPSIKEKIKGFKKLITVKLKPMKKGEVREVQFPIYLDEWYASQQMLDEHREMVIQHKRETMEEMRSLYEGESKALERIDEYLRNLEGSLESIPHLKVKIQVSNENAYWNTGNNLFFMPISDADKEVDGSGMMPEARWVADEVKRIVIHEMTHAGQTILSYISLKLKDFFSDYARLREQSNLAGLPSKKIRTPQYKQNQNHSRGDRFDSERHHLDDIEFYTDLRDAVRELMKKIKTQEERFLEYGRPIKPQDKNLLFKALVGQDISREERRRSDFLNYVRPIQFFLSLKRKAKPKYIKAVGEAYKLVFGSFAHQRMAERIALVHLERKKWVEAPPKQFSQDQQEQLWVIYDLSYSKVGKHISSKSELMRNYDIFWVVDVAGDDEIDAFVSYSTTRFGKKIGLIGSDGSSEGRNAMLMKGAELLLKRGWYAEVDARFARLLKKRLGVNHIQDETQVRAVLNKPLEWDDDKKCYTRNLEGKGDVVKYLVGLPNI
jgi:hypothetical protein